MSYKEFSLKIAPIKSVSPSRFLGLQKCALREIWGLSNSPLLPSLPYNYFGKLVHLMFENSSNGIVNGLPALETFWAIELEKIEREMKSDELAAHFLPLSKWIKNFHVKRQICFKHSLKLFENIAFHKINDGQSALTTYTGPELQLKTLDGKIAGKVDFIRDNGFGIEIIDYKTGAIFEDDGVIKADYKVQLKIYAGIYHEVYDELPSKLIVVGLNGEEYFIDFTKNECAELLLGARKLFDDINSCIKNKNSSELFAQPSLDNCKYCQYRPACQKYWQNMPASGLFCDLRGKVKDIVPVLNGTISIVLDNDNVDIRIRGINKDCHKFYNFIIGDDVMVFNLRLDANGTFTTTATTTFY
jgi:CRISPR/Cas system-associated exonuclease Cas4 (RecB family)